MNGVLIPNPDDGRADGLARPSRLISLRQANMRHANTRPLIFCIIVAAHLSNAQDDGLQAHLGQDDDLQCLSWCLAPLLGDKNDAALLPPPSADALSTAIRGASAKRVGELGEYLACKRLVNGTRTVANYALVQFSTDIASHTTPTATPSVYFGCCVPTTCAASDIELGFRRGLPRLIRSAESKLVQSEQQTPTRLVRNR